MINRLEIFVNLPLYLTIYRQHQAVDELFDADLAAVTAFTADVIHLCPDFLEWEQGAGVCSKGFIHEILNTMCQVRHADRDRTADTLLHVLRRIAQKLAELTDADLEDRASVVVQILADPKDISPPFSPDMPRRFKM